MAEHPFTEDRVSFVSPDVRQALGDGNASRRLLGFRPIRSVQTPAPVLALLEAAHRVEEDAMDRKLTLDLPDPMTDDVTVRLLALRDAYEARAYAEGRRLAGLA